MADATLSGQRRDLRFATAGAAAAGEVRQMADGSAGVLVGSAASAGRSVTWRTEGQYVMTKATGFVALDGGRAYWDHSANAVTYKKVSDRDFYLGRFVGDATSAATSCTVNLNEDPPYDIDLARDPFATTIIGTQALGGLGISRRGGAHNFKLDATNEAQKLDALSKDGFATGANAIVELCYNVVSDGAGADVDVSLGIANATHATDADAITRHLFVHLDANSTNNSLQSKDGVTTVAATDTTTDYTEGAGQANREEWWFDMRNPADVQIYRNGSLVLGSTVFDVSASVATWFLLAHIEKTASTDTYEFDLEWMRVRFAEQ